MLTGVDANADPILPTFFFRSSLDLFDQDALQTDIPLAHSSLGSPVLYLNGPRNALCRGTYYILSTSCQSRLWWRY
jgi:hypothetical protein